MPNTQSRVRRTSNRSRSNRGPRAGRSGNRPDAPRRAASTGARNRRSRSGNAAARPRRGPNARPGRRPTRQLAGRSRGRGRGDGSRRSLGASRAGRGTRNPAPVEEDFQVGGRAPDPEDMTQEARERRANERRLRQDHPLLYGRTDE